MGPNIGEKTRRKLSRGEHGGDAAVGKERCAGIKFLETSQVHRKVHELGAQMQANSSCSGSTLNGFRFRGETSIQRQKPFSISQSNVQFSDPLTARVHLGQLC